MKKLQISLAAARVNAGYTQEEVARILHISKVTLGAWENGRSEPKIAQARLLSELYNIPLDNIFLAPKSN